MGRFYWSNFANIQNKIAINKIHLTRLCYVDTNEKRVMTYAYFDDGNIIKLFNPNRKYFFKKFKIEIEQACGIKFEDITKEVINQNLKKDQDEQIKN